MNKKTFAGIEAGPRSSEDGGSTIRDRSALDEPVFDAAYDRWFSRAAAWSLRQGCTGREVEFVVATALEAFFREDPLEGSRDETELAARLLAHLHRARNILADRPPKRRPAAIASPGRRLSAAGSRA
jgi:hypothetical protein